LKWLKSAYPDGLLEDAIPGEEYIERVCWGYFRMFPASISIFCDSSGHELQISFTLRSSNGSVPEAEALLSIIYEGKELLYARKSSHEDHEELAFMLKFLSLFTDMWCCEERYFKERCLLEKRAIAVDKYYASLK
jgi:hypothetical protein